MPSLSVIIPVYNSSGYLRQCLDSVLVQTLSDIEVICVDDGSTDGSKEIIREYCLLDPRIRLIEQDNLGAGAARNNGICYATGDYVHYLDSDDWLEPWAYERAYRKAVVAGVDVCIFQKYLYDNATGVSTPSIRAFEEDDHITSFEDNPSFFVHSPVVPWNKISRRDLIVDNHLKFDEIVCANDRTFHFSLVTHARSIMVTRDIPLYYRINNTKSLIGTTRSKHYDAHFIAFRSTMSSCADEPPEIKRLLIDAAFIDLFKFYDKAHPVYKRRIYRQLNEFFNEVDLSCFEGDYSRNTWADRMDYIRDHKNGFPVFFAMEHMPHPVRSFEDRLKTIADSLPDRPVWNGCIASLTSYPARIGTIHETVSSILAQTVVPERIMLWLAWEQFEHEKEDLPPELLRLEAYGLEIVFCDDLKPHKKYYYAMADYPDAVIITMDDDVIYPPDTVEMLKESYLRHPSAVSAMRVHRMCFTGGELDPYGRWGFNDDSFYDNPSFLAMATGVGGVLYPPHCFSPEIFDKRDINETCLFGDDLWLKMNEILNRVPTVLAAPSRKLDYVDGTQETALWLDNKEAGRNDSQIQSINNLFRDKIHIDLLKMISKSYGECGIEVSILLDMNNIESSDNISELIDSLPLSWELILYDTEHGIFTELRDRFASRSDVIVMELGLRRSPLLAVAKCSRGEWCIVSDSISAIDIGEIARSLNNSDFKGVLDPANHLSIVLRNDILCRYTCGLNDELSLFVFKYDSSTSKTINLSSDSVVPMFHNSISLRRMHELLDEAILVPGPDVDERVMHALTGCATPEEERMLDSQSLFDCSPLGGNRVICPICMSHFTCFRPAGINLRDNAECPKCGSFERHRAAMQHIRLLNRHSSHLLRILFVNVPGQMHAIMDSIGVDYVGLDKFGSAYWNNDIIVLCHLIQNQSDPEALIKRAHSKLKKSGILILTVPVKTVRGRIHFIQELEVDLFELRELVDLCGFRTRIVWNKDEFSYETLHMFSIIGNDVALICERLRSISLVDISGENLFSHKI